MRRPFIWACAAAALPAAHAHAAAVMTTETGKAVHWEKTTVTVAADPAFASRSLSPEAVALAIEEAAAAWNALPEMRVKLVRATAPGEAAVQVRFCRSAWTRAAGLLGHSKFDAAVATGLVQSAVVEVNDCDFKFVGPEDVADGALDLQAVLTHEFGHLLGLNHSEDPGAVMFTSTGTVRQRRPNPDDRRALASIYGNATAPPQPGQMNDPTEKAQSYMGGKEAPLPFELPWPFDLGKASVRFVPTVLPLPPRAKGAPRVTKPPQSNAKAPRVDPSRAANKRTATDDQPVSTELPWPGAGAR